MKTQLLLFVFLIPGVCATAQKKSWDVFSKKTGTEKSDIRVNNALYEIGPVTQTPYLVKITHMYTGTAGSKLPTKTEATRLVGIQDATKKILSAKTETYLSGAASHNRQCDIYCYVKDTTALRPFIQSQYKKKYGSNYTILIKHDPKWNEYYTVLYPSEEERQMMYYQRVIANLLRQGDKLKKPRKVTHWAYFKDEDNMAACVTRLRDNHFAIDMVNQKRYQRNEIRFSHTIPLTSASVLGAVRDIKKSVSVDGGTYGGWQTVVRR